MNQAPKQPNIFGPVLAAILVAAAIAFLLHRTAWSLPVLARFL
jgi:hypothetical protein